MGAELTLAGGGDAVVTPRWIGDWEREKLWAEYLRLCQMSLDRGKLSFSDYVWLLLKGVHAASRAGMGSEEITSLWNKVMDQASAVTDPANRRYAQFCAATGLYLVNPERTEGILREIAAYYAEEKPTEKSPFLGMFDPVQSSWAGHFGGSPWVLIPEVVRAQLSRYEEVVLQSRQPEFLLRVYRGYLDAGLGPEAMAWRERCERQFAGDTNLSQRLTAAARGAATDATVREWYRAYFRQDINELERLAGQPNPHLGTQRMRSLIGSIYFHLGLDDALVRWVAATKEIPFSVGRDIFAVDSRRLAERLADALGDSPVAGSLLTEAALAALAAGLPDESRRLRQKFAGTGNSAILARRAWLDACLDDFESSSETLARLEQAGVLQRQNTYAEFLYMTAAARRMSDVPRVARYEELRGEKSSSPPEILVLLGEIDEALDWGEPGSFSSIRMDWMDKLNWLLMDPQRLATLPWRHELMAEQVALKLLWRSGGRPARGSAMVSIPRLSP